MVTFMTTYFGDLYLSIMTFSDQLKVMQSFEFSSSVLGKDHSKLKRWVCIFRGDKHFI